MKNSRKVAVLFITVAIIAGCTKKRDGSISPTNALPPVPSSYSFYGRSEIEDIKYAGKRHFVKDLNAEIAVFDTVFFNPDNTEYLRKYLRISGISKGKTILDIGTGTGLLALVALKYGAISAVATDINPLAAVNAIYNADLTNMTEKMDVRLVSMDEQDAYSIVRKDEKFDLIISNPPWHDQRASHIEEYGVMDYKYTLLKSIIRGLRTHLKEDGRCLIVYGSVSGYKMVKKLVKKYDLRMKIINKALLPLLLNRNNNSKGIVIEITVL